MIFTILATGQSLTQEDVDYVRGKSKVIAVSNAYTMAPWADFLVSADRKWWMSNREALRFEGRKIIRQAYPGLEHFTNPRVPYGYNSGLFAMHVAKREGASKIILLGFDMHGTHFFGAHPEPLKNTTDRRFADHIRQFNGFEGCEVINSTPNSALTKFPMMPLREVL